MSAWETFWVHWPLLMPGREPLSMAALLVFIVVAVAHLLVGGRLEDHGATLGTGLAGAILGAGVALDADLSVGLSHRVTGGAMLGAVGALVLDGLSVRLGLVVVGGVMGGLLGEMLGATEEALRVLVVGGALSLPWLHAPWPRASSAMVAALVLGWARVLPAGASGVIFVWGIGMMAQIWLDARRLSKDAPRETPSAG